MSQIGPKKFIAVAGNMGSGKSTLVEFLHREFGFKPFYEPNVNNPYLKDFYADMKRWAFHSQLFFLTHKFHIHLQLSKESGAVVQDRTIYEDADVFAENLYRMGYIEDRDYKTYREIYEIMLKTLRKPDILIYLDCGIKTIKKRIKTRGRVEEQNIPLDYLKRLDALYQEWFRSYKYSPALIIQTNKLNYIEDLVDRIDLLKLIEKYVKS